MKVLIFEPGKHPRAADIEHTLEEMQKIVGGYIQAIYPWREPAALVCDDEGLLKEYPFNRRIGDEHMIFGTFFICGLDTENFTDLSPELMRKYSMDYFDPQMLMQTPFGLVVLPVEAEA